jgi:tight adherence protein B
MSGALLVGAASSGFLQSTGGAVLASVLGGLLIGVAVLSVAVPKRDVGRRIGSFVNPTTSAVSKQASLVERALGDRSQSQLERSPFLQRLALELDVAGLQLTVQSLLLLTIVGSVLVGWILYTSTSSPLAAALGLLTPGGVFVGIRTAADRQRRAFDDQLPDNLQVIASAMRAGQTFVGALATVLDDAPEPSRRELKRAVTDERIGVPIDEALNRVTVRMHSDEFAHVTMVAALQREAGGNTAEVIDLVCETIRERLDIVRMVRGLTAQGRLAGGMLSLLPVGMLIAISVINPQYIRPMFHTTAGVIALGVSGFMVLLGGLAIRKIITIKI